MTTAALDTARSRGDVLILTTALVGALAVRVAVAGAAGAASMTAGLVFAAIVAAVALACRPPAALSARTVGIGLAGAAVVVLPAVVVLDVTDVRSGSGYAGWALATTCVATAEEALLRGALFTAVSRWRGTDAAVVAAAEVDGERRRILRHGGDRIRRRRDDRRVVAAGAGDLNVHELRDGGVDAVAQ